MSDDTVLRCQIIDDDSMRACIEADIGHAWFDKSEYSIVKLSHGGEPDLIRISLSLAIARGIT